MTDDKKDAVLRKCGILANYETLREIVDATIAAHTEKLLAEVEMPEPQYSYCVYADISPFRGSNDVGYTAEQLQQYGDARAAAAALNARREALDEAKEVCKNFTVVPEVMHLTSILLLEEIEALKGKVC